MNRTLLNADVLLLVFALANKQTQLALLSTCKLLYREGGKQFLKSTMVDIESEKDMLSFVRFMDADGGSRMRFFRCLYIDFEEPSESVARQFKNMIEHLIHASQLTYLSLCDLEGLLSAYPPLSKAIAELTSLKEVSFPEIGELSLKMLMSMRSNVKTAGIDLGSVYDDVSHDRGCKHAIMFLRQFCSSLRILNIIGGCDEVEPQDGDPQYPLLSTLAMDNPSPFVTWNYVRTFPNLKNLFITEIFRTVYETAVVGLSEFRARNLAQLRQRGCWESLDCFRGPILMLWLLGLPCTISQLELADDLGYVTHVTTDMLRDVLGPARTTRLDICIYPISLFLDEEFTRAFTETCAATLKELSLMLQIRSNEHTEHGEESHLGDVLDSVADTLRVCSMLESITLRIRFSEARESAYAQDIDLDAACTAFHKAVPSAKYIQLTIWDHPTQGTVEIEIRSEGDSK